MHPVFPDTCQCIRGPALAQHREVLSWIVKGIWYQFYLIQSYSIPGLGQGNGKKRHLNIHTLINFKNLE
jgi:hypothetical protein